MKGNGQLAVAKVKLVIVEQDFDFIAGGIHVSATPVPTATE